MSVRSPERSRALGTLLLGVVLVLGCEPAAPPSRGAESPGSALQQRPGEWLLINYWAEWCRPCLEEIPALNAFARQHADRARVLMVNYDELRGDALREQAARLGIEAELLETDPSPRFGYERPQVLPSTFVIAPDGVLHRTLLGPQTVASLAAATGGG